MTVDGMSDEVLINGMFQHLGISKGEAKRLLAAGAVRVDGDIVRVGKRRAFPLPPLPAGHPTDMPTEKLQAFVTSLRPARDLLINLDQGTLKRVRAYIDRIEQSQPGMGYAPGEADQESLLVAVGGLLDRALTESEADVGLHYDFLTGRLKPSRLVTVRTRIKRAWWTLRRGW